MKTIFTLFFIFVILTGSYAQNVPTSGQKSGTLLSDEIHASQAFLIKKVYPNPVFDRITVDIRSEVSGTVEFSLFNILGTEVKKWTSTNMELGDQQFKFDLSFLKTGVYILKVSGPKQIVSQVIRKN